MPTIFPRHSSRAAAAPHPPCHPPAPGTAGFGLCAAWNSTCYAWAGRPRSALAIANHRPSLNTEVAP